MIAPQEIYLYISYFNANQCQIKNHIKNKSVVTKIIASVAILKRLKMTGQGNSTSNVHLSVDKGNCYQYRYIYQNFEHF